MIRRENQALKYEVANLKKEKHNVEIMRDILLNKVEELREKIEEFKTQYDEIEEQQAPGEESDNFLPSGLMQSIRFTTSDYEKMDLIDYNVLRALRNSKAFGEKSVVMNLILGFTGAEND